MGNSPGPFHRFYSEADCWFFHGCFLLPGQAGWLVKPGERTVLVSHARHDARMMQGYWVRNSENHYLVLEILLFHIGSGLLHFRLPNFLRVFDPFQGRRRPTFAWPRTMMPWMWPIALASFKSTTLSLCVMLLREKNSATVSAYGCGVRNLHLT